MITELARKLRVLLPVLRPSVCNDGAVFAGKIPLINKMISGQRNLSAYEDRQATEDVLDTNDIIRVEAREALSSLRTSKSSRTT